MKKTFLSKIRKKRVILSLFFLLILKQANKNTQNLLIFLSLATSGFRKKNKSMGGRGETTKIKNKTRCFLRAKVGEEDPKEIKLNLTKCIDKKPAKTFQEGIYVLGGDVS